MVTTGFTLNRIRYNLVGGPIAWNYDNSSKLEIYEVSNNNGKGGFAFIRNYGNKIELLEFGETKKDLRQILKDDTRASPLFNELIRHKFI